MAEVTAYAITPSTGADPGALTFIGTFGGAGGLTVQPTGIAASGKFVYTSNNPSTTIAGFSIDSAPVPGALSNLSDSPFAGLPAQTGVVAHPNNQYVYVLSSNLGQTQVGVFSVNPLTGTLEPILGSPFMTTGFQNPIGITLDPLGERLFTTNTGGSIGVVIFAVDPNTGALEKVGDVRTTSASPVAVAVDPSSESAYVVGGPIGAGKIQGFIIDGDTLQPGTTIAAGVNPVGVVVDPSGKFV